MNSRGRILVVDDDRLVLATVSHGLAQAGYEVIDADNGDDAILLAREHRPDLALLDIRMEGKSGFDVAAYLRDVAHLPFMFLSAFADEDTVSKVNALGAVAYLVKPLDVAQIVPAVTSALERARAQAKAVPGAAPRVAPRLDLVAVAAGVLMQRGTISREAALVRLDKLAQERGLTLEAQAERLVAAVEELARAGG
jgi:response regulator NasT